MTKDYTKDPAFAPHFESAEQLFHELANTAASTVWRKLEHDEVEDLITAAGREVIRCLLDGHMALRGTGKAAEPVVGADEVERSHERESVRHLGTGLGEVTVPRTGYSEQGVNNLFPVDADLNLPKDKYSLTIRRLAAEYASMTSFDNATELLKKSTAANPGKRQVEEMVCKASVDFEDFYEETRLDVPAEKTGEVLVLTFDMKGIIVRPEDLRAKTRAAAEAEEAKPALDKGKDAPKKQRKRMAMVTAVYTVAPWVRTPEVFAAILGGETPEGEEHRNRPACENKRVWASIKRKAKNVVEEGFREALGRDPERQKTWVILVDGDPKQLRWIKKAARRFRVDVTIVLDIIHVTQYIWKAGKDLHPEKSQREALEQWVHERVLKVLEGKAGLVAGGMRRSATKRNLAKKDRARIDKCAKYLKKYKQYLRYDKALAEGTPIATGVIEGACRHLIADRMDITGARWRVEGAEAVLKIRALRSSGDFEAYWHFHREKEYERNHGSRYVAGVHPKLSYPTKFENLRMVA